MLISWAAGASNEKEKSCDIENLLMPLQPLSQRSSSRGWGQPPPPPASGQMLAGVGAREGVLAGRCSWHPWEAGMTWLGTWPVWPHFCVMATPEAELREAKCSRSTS